MPPKKTKIKPPSKRRMDNRNALLDQMDSDITDRQLKLIDKMINAKQKTLDRKLTLLDRKLDRMKKK